MLLHGLDSSDSEGEDREQPGLTLHDLGVASISVNKFSKSQFELFTAVTTSVTVIDAQNQIKCPQSISIFTTISVKKQLKEQPK